MKGDNKLFQWHGNERLNEVLSWTRMSSPGLSWSASVKLVLKLSQAWIDACAVSVCVCVCARAA